MSAAKHTPGQIDALFAEFCAERGIVMDSKRDREDYALRGHLFDDPGSDVNDAVTKAASNLLGALRLCQRELRKLSFKDDDITSALEAAQFAIVKATGSKS